MNERRREMIVTREKQIICGNDYKEVDIIKCVANKKLCGRGKKKALSSPAQKSLNDKKSMRYLTQLINANFKDYRDYLCHLTYKDDALPETVEEAEKRVRNFIRRINYELKKRGEAKCKYIVITTETSSKTGELTRVHHHMIISCELTKDEIFMMWQEGRRNIDPLQGEEDKYNALVEYLRKNAGSRNGKKKWISSRGLLTPMEKVPNDNKYTARQVEKIAKMPLDREEWERKYPGWTLINSDSAYSAEYNELTGWNIYLKLRRKLN
jgi:hypothetical protein